MRKTTNSDEPKVDYKTATEDWLKDLMNQQSILKGDEERLKAAIEGREQKMKELRDEQAVDTLNLYRVRGGLAVLNGAVQSIKNKLNVKSED